MSSNLLLRFEFSIFTTSRVLSLLSRPLFLLLLMSYGGGDLSADYALIITVVQFGLVFLNSEAHKDFYKRLLGSDSSLKLTGKTRLRYINYIRAHFQSFYVLLFVFCFLMTEDLLFAFMLSLACCAEKMYDEFQRLCIYQKQYLLWSLICLVKFYFPILCFAAMLYISDQHQLFVYLFLMIYIGTILFLVLGLSEFRLKSISRFYSIKFYFKHYLLKNRSLIAYTLLVSNVLYLDRLVVSYQFNKHLDQYVLLCNICVILVVVYDYLYLTKKKPEYIELVKEPLRLVFNTKNLLFSVGFAFTAALVGLTINNYFNLLVLDKITMLSLVAGYALYNLISPMVHYNYWNCDLEKILKIEFLSICVYAISIFLLLSYGMQGVALSFVFFNATRFTMYVLSQRLQENRI